MLSILKSLMKQNLVFMNLFSWIYNILHYNNSWKYKLRNTISYSGAFLKGSSFHIRGKNNIIEFGPKAR